jgi:alpha-tubulin suppressor-like RCC1 family protein
MRRAGIAAALGVALAGCESEPASLDLNGPPAAIALVSGDEQTGPINAPLGQPLVVQILDDAGKPTPAIPVNWSGPGLLSAAVDSTDNDGFASVTWTLPDAPGSYQATASAGSAGSATFTATATPPGGQLVFRYIDAGSYHTCGITTTEQLQCWGYNGDGQLGLEASTQPTLYPTEVPSIQRYRLVSGGRYHTCGVSLSGGVICWGQDRDNRSTLGDPVSFQSISAGMLHTCAVSASRAAWCWGWNGEGQVGGQDTSVVIAEPGLVGFGYRSVSAGGLHTCAVRENGSAWCWGFSAEGQLGNDTTARRINQPIAVEGGLVFQTDPLLVPPEPDPNFPLPPGPFIAAGHSHTCAIATSGQTWCWGLNENGQLGSGGTAGGPVPRAVLGGAFVRITAGQSHSCGILSSGQAFCWGDNSHGQLGDGTAVDRQVPTAVAGGLTFSYLKAGDLSTCGVTPSGVAYCWGNGEYGQLGVGTRTDSSTPVKVAFQP